MAVVIKIATVDESSEIDWTSVQLNRAITNQTDTLTFSIRRPDSAGIKPLLSQTVEVIEDGTTLFLGQIIEVHESIEGKLETFDCVCKDLSFDMDRKLIIKIYENMSVNSIIADMVATFIPGYTTTNVNCPIVINYIAFNYEYPSKCLQQLAQITNYDWYVDDNYNIFFFQKAGVNAPFNLTDTNGKYIYNTLEINRDIKNLRNSIIVRGGEYLGASTSETLIADGSQTTFLQAYRYSGIAVTVAAVSKTVGVDNIDDPTLFDCLYNFQEKAIKFPSASKPTVGQAVVVSGQPYYPVITKVVNPASVAQYGEFQYKIIDKSINSKEAARDRARAEITQWALEVNEGGFSTLSTGLETGQVINIQSTIRGINQDFVISRIKSKMQTPTSFRHMVTLVTSQTYGMIEFLSSLLIDKDKQIVINADEVLDYITSFNDQFTVTDSIGTPTYRTGPYKYNLETWAHKIPITIKNTKVSGSSIISGYPVYVDLSHLPAAFFSGVKTDGSDIRIYQSDNATECPFELLSIDTTLKTGSLYFKGDVDGATDTVFYIWYGNPSASAYAATDPYGSQNVWGTSAKYVGHFNTNGADSTSSANTGTVTGAANVTGKIGNAESFGSLNSDKIAITNGAGQLFNNTDVTISFIVKRQTIGNVAYFFAHPNTAGNGNRVSINTDSTNKIILVLGSGGAAGATAITDTTTYHHVVAFFKRSTREVKFYLDGSLDLAYTASSGTAPGTGLSNCAVGNKSTSGTQSAAAIIDEFKFYNTLLSDDQALTEYNNLMDTVNFYTIGSVDYAQNNVGIWNYSTWS